MSSVPQHPQLVLEVTTIDTVIKESFPPQVQSTVYGTVPSTGWLQPYLAPYTYASRHPRMASMSLISWPSPPKAGQPR